MGRSRWQANGTDATARELGEAKDKLRGEFERRSRGLTVTPLDATDAYADNVGFVDGFPVAGDKRRVWLAHCYAWSASAAATSSIPATDRNLYAVIGHAPRHLDRNVTLIGRVIAGIEHLASLPRGTGRLGFYDSAGTDVRIDSIELVSDRDEANRPAWQRLRTDTDTFARWSRPSGPATTSGFAMRWVVSSCATCRCRPGLRHPRRRPNKFRIGLPRWIDAALRYTFGVWIDREIVKRDPNSPKCHDRMAHSDSGRWPAWRWARAALSDEDRLERAQAAFEAGDVRSAAIDVRTILQSAPDDVGARILLGRTAMAQGDMGAAEAAFRRAVELGADRSAVAVDLAGAMLAQRKYANLLDEITPELAADAEDRFAIQMTRADALLGLGRPRDARLAFTALQEEQPANSAARFGVASAYLAENDDVAAREVLNALLSRDPDFAVARLASGSLALRQADLELAIAEFTQASGLAESRIRDDALAGLVEAHLAQNDLAAAATALAELEASSPDGLPTRYLGARLAFARGDTSAAEPTLALLLRDAPSFEPARLLMTAMQLQAGNLSQAEVYAANVLRDNPNSEQARVLLAEVMLRQGRGRDVLALIEPAVDSARNQDALRALAIRSGLQTGEYESTLDLLRARVDADPENADAAIELAGTLMAAGQIAAAETVMTNAQLASDRDTVRKTSLTIYAALKRGDARSAIQQASDLTRELPSDPDAQFLLGNTALAAGRIDLARLAFGETTRLAPDSLSPYLSLAAIAQQSGDTDAARGHLAAAIDANPDALIPAVRLAKLEYAAGNIAAARQVLSRILASNPTATAAELTSAEISLDLGEFQRAYDEAAAVAERLPANGAAQNLCGAALERLGEPTRAATHFAAAIDAEPTNSQYRINAARAYSAAGELTKALAVLTDASGQPRWQDLPLAAALASVRANQGDLGSALAIARDLREYHPESPAPYAIEAGLLASGGDHAGAAAAYDEALRLSPFDRRLVVRAHGARLAAGVDNPEAPLSEYLDRRPDDLMVRTILGQSFSARGMSAEAIETYEKALASAPDSVTLVNNLAWEYARAGDARAEPLARRGYALDPGNANVVDTLGWILVRNGKAAEGVEVLREALALAGNRPEIRYHLAAGLVRAGRTAEGRQALEAVLASADDFPGRDAAQALLDSVATNSL